MSCIRQQRLIELLKFDNLKNNKNTFINYFYIIQYQASKKEDSVPVQEIKMSFNFWMDKINV